MWKSMGRYDGILGDGCIFLLKAPTMRITSVGMEVVYTTVAAMDRYGILILALLVRRALGWTILMTNRWMMCSCQCSVNGVITYIFANS